MKIPRRDARGGEREDDKESVCPIIKQHLLPCIEHLHGLIKHVIIVQVSNKLKKEVRTCFRVDPTRTDDGFGYSTVHSSHASIALLTSVLIVSHEGL